MYQLGRVTSGVLLFAKDPHTAGILSTTFREGEISKCYFGMKSTKKLAVEKQGCAVAFSDSVRETALPAALKYLRIVTFVIIIISFIFLSCKSFSRSHGSIYTLLQSAVFRATCFTTSAYVDLPLGIAGILVPFLYPCTGLSEEPGGSGTLA